jgi:hypothetical protein
MTGYLGGAMGMAFGVQSGEERQFDFTGAGTVLLQSSESMLSDPHLVQQIEGQIGGLGTPGLSHLQNVIARQLGQQQR